MNRKTIMAMPVKCFWTVVMTSPSSGGGDTEYAECILTGQDINLIQHIRK